MAFYAEEPPADATVELREMLRATTQELATKFAKLIEADIASGKITLLE